MYMETTLKYTQCARAVLLLMRIYSFRFGARQSLADTSLTFRWKSTIKAQETNESLPIGLNHCRHIIENCSDIFWKFLPFLWKYFILFLAFNLTLAYFGQLCRLNKRCIVLHFIWNIIDQWEETAKENLVLSWQVMCILLLSPPYQIWLRLSYPIHKVLPVVPHKVHLIHKCLTRF